MRTCMASEAFLIYPKRSCGLFAMQRLRQIVKYAADISLVEKSTVRKNPSLFISTSKWGKESIAFSTSGSTGEPSTANVVAVRRMKRSGGWA